LMLWISIPKDAGYLDALRKSFGDNEGTQKLWVDIEMSSTGVAVQGPHIEEIGRTLWREDNEVMRCLSRDAFTDPHRLASDVLLF